MLHHMPNSSCSGPQVTRSCRPIHTVRRAFDERDPALRGLPELQVLHTTNGRWDQLAETRADSPAAFDRVVRKIRMVDGLLNSKVSLLPTSV